MPMCLPDLRRQIHIIVVIERPWERCKIEYLGFSCARYLYRLFVWYSVPSLYEWFSLIHRISEFENALNKNWKYYWGVHTWMSIKMYFNFISSFQIHLKSLLRNINVKYLLLCRLLVQPQNYIHFAVGGFLIFFK